MGTGRAAAIVAIGLLACGRSDLLLDDLPRAIGGGPTRPEEPDDASTGDAEVPYFMLDSSTDAPHLVDAGRPKDAEKPPSDSGCGPATCPNGCCAPEGTCSTTLDEQACGYFGEACTMCSLLSLCQGGACVAGYGPWAKCGPGTCTGCCLDPYYCADGVHGVACGHHGEQCARCAPQEGTGMCEAYPGGGGACTMLTSCGRSNCAGCCFGNVCTVGTQNDACGSGGAACGVCTGGGTCVAGSCQ
jgi:hypothetical protein